MSTTTKTFTLPGAERFAEYLMSIVEGRLTAEGPEIVDRSYDGQFGKEWIVKLDGKPLGTYNTFGPKPGETEFGRQYVGRLPGYVNEAIASMNRGRPEEEERVPVDTVSLSYDNKRFEARPIHEGPGKLTDTPWQRQDGHDKIPFP